MTRARLSVYSAGLVHPRVAHRHGRPRRGGLSSMAEHRIVAPKVTGSSPVGHPSLHRRSAARGRSAPLPSVGVRLLVGLAMLSILSVGCGFELAPSGLECQRTPADGRDLSEGRHPLADDEPLAGLDVRSMGAAEIGDAAVDAGLGVTWRYSYDVGEQPETGSVGYSECWCVPPPGGAVIDVAYDSLGRIVVLVDSGEHRTSVGPQPRLGWGCDSDTV